MAIEKDPVCGMDVDTETSTLSLEHDGKTYWFCGKGCLLEFRDDPDKYPTRPTSRRGCSRSREAVQSRATCRANDCSTVVLIGHNHAISSARCASRGSQRG